MKIIKVTCQGADDLSIEGLKFFQGNLKELTKEKGEKLQKAIIEYGFSFPVMVWNNWVINGHQRLFTLKKLLKEGYVLIDKEGNKTNKIPVVYIEATNKKEAAQKLLLENSKFGQMTEEGLYEFMSVMELEPIDLEGLELPDIDLEHFKEGYLNTLPPEEKGKTEKGNIKCPACGHEF